MERILAVSRIRLFLLTVSWLAGSVWIAGAGIAVVLEPVATGLDRPVQVVTAHDGSGSLFVAQQNGAILRVSQQGDSRSTFLDLSPIVSCCSNGGLLSVLFHPAYMSNGRLYVLYVDRNGNTVLSRYQRSETNPGVADPQSAQILFVAEQPKDNLPNHHGGTLQFGVDGMLYVSIGDGGAYTQVTNRAQETNHLLGKLLRLDVEHAATYSIPADNPLVGVPGAREEIWSRGLRNPWRFSFDRSTGELYIGDVGQDSWEEIDVVTLAEAKGANFGWPILEGNHCFPPDKPCTTIGLVPPKIEYPHASGCSVTGGYRYRGGKWPRWYGLYFYGDWCSGRLWGASQKPDGSWTSSEVESTGAMIVSFGEDDQGELYLVDYRGAVYRMSGVAQRRHSVAH
jgi:glucose/arabinose dehydrogenase